MGETLVLGLGNTLRGDDGVGSAVIASLQTEQSLPPEVDLLDAGTPGLDIVLLLEGYRRALIVDAANMGCAPGQWRRFAAESLMLENGNGGLQGTLHNAGLVEALQLANALNTAPPELIIYGVQPENLDWTVGLSEAVREAIPAIQRAVLNELTE